MAPAALSFLTPVHRCAPSKNLIHAAARFPARAARLGLQLCCRRFQASVETKNLIYTAARFPGLVAVVAFNSVADVAELVRLFVVCGLFGCNNKPHQHTTREPDCPSSPPAPHLAPLATVCASASASTSAPASALTSAPEIPAYLPSCLLQPPPP
eukprot:scaffold11027_cov63-Phaeocystis_antarctica.AAC.2